ncbi:hypothetical protein HanXRQr2_Chr10g0462671 [Helianthus annuus]|uniref:Uncharacterized protein n=1 Tax=Helianthus annuus TaxID=4232 RepID=A0A9K3I1F6_HELAN|nr:hypothetical protein HanXRQr2_Chr10g0462671 [Helianthus annuus]KAJ0885551.1 hypothetical protein HanPSC8_Chr10g0446491 [Helianthus annuus]
MRLHCWMFNPTNVCPSFFKNGALLFEILEQHETERICKPIKTPSDKQRNPLSVTQHFETSRSLSKKQ